MKTHLFELKIKLFLPEYEDMITDLNRCENLFWIAKTARQQLNEQLLGYAMLKNENNVTTKINGETIGHVMKPTNNLRWYTNHLDTYSKPKLQQQWILDSGETEWKNIPEESNIKS